MSVSCAQEANNSVEVVQGQLPFDRQKAKTLYVFMCMCTVTCVCF